MTGDPLDRIEAYARDRATARLRPGELEALVEIARAARALIADREGANIGEERLALRAALARLEETPE